MNYLRVTNYNWNALTDNLGSEAEWRFSDPSPVRRIKIGSEKVFFLDAPIEMENTFLFKLLQLNKKYYLHCLGCRFLWYRCHIIGGESRCGNSYAEHSEQSILVQVFGTMLIVWNDSSGLWSTSVVMAMWWAMLTGEFRRTLSVVPRGTHLGMYRLTCGLILQDCWSGSALLNFFSIEETTIFHSPRIRSSSPAWAQIWTTLAMIYPDIFNVEEVCKCTIHAPQKRKGSTKIGRGNRLVYTNYIDWLLYMNDAVHYSVEFINILNFSSRWGLQCFYYGTWDHPYYVMTPVCEGRPYIWMSSRRLAVLKESSFSYHASHLFHPLAPELAHLTAR